MLSDQEKSFVMDCVYRIQDWANNGRPLDPYLRGQIRELMAIIDREIQDPGSRAPPAIVYNVHDSVLNRVAFPKNGGL